MRRWQYFCVLLSVVLSGCAVREEVHIGDCGKEGVLLAESFCVNDADSFMRPLSQETRKKFGKKEFRESRENVCRRLGKPVQKKYIGKLRHPFLDIALWKITFERDGKDGQIYQDALFQVVSVKENGEEKVISFGFL